MERNFEKDNSIDPNALDVECLQQSNLTYYYSKQLADTEDKIKKHELRMEVELGELELRIREDSSRYGVDEKKIKVTEAVIKNMMAQQEEYQDLHKEQIRLLHEQSLLKAAVKAIDKKDKALENLIKLAGMNYFSTPTEPRNLNREALKNSAMNEKINERMEKNQEILKRRK